MANPAVCRKTDKRVDLRHQFRAHGRMGSLKRCVQNMIPAMNPRTVALAIELVPFGRISYWA